MTKRFHGITSLLLAAIAIAIAVATAFQTSWVLGSVYLSICLLAPPAIIYAYCAKCACKAHCAHVLPGPGPKLFFRALKSSRSTSPSRSVSPGIVSGTGACATRKPTMPSYSAIPTAGHQAVSAVDL